MHDRASYATACAGASIGDAQPINDPIGLLPEHLNSITFEWNAHLIKQKISGNYLRILNAIYHQTIDFNKWEDDLAGKRLQQLTHIRYDHSNFILKRLYERNIILKRKGSFGSIVSINFDFSTWGKQYKQDEPHDANNDPCLLLSEEIRNNPIDDGIDLGLSDDFHAPPMVTQKTTPADTDIPVEKPQPKAKVITPYG